ncbi:hypothetical protein ACVI1L_002356 [Bradyrhizobium sp. USDA 4516]
MILLAPEKLEVRAASEAIIQWPAEPYKGLNFFQRTDAPLFGERDSDVSNCAAILGSATNKVLLLHGRSGTGKSSFLRAGLLPELRRARFYSFESAGAGEEPLLVRCTADPLRQLRHTLQLRLIDPDCSAILGQIGREKALSLLQAEPAVDQISTADRLLEAFHYVSAASSRPILFTIDQGEEIFTLGSSPETKAAFFYLIEELCIRHIDLKLIVSIRTEYYGQFCDQLRIDPNLIVSTSRTSLDQYMLHGLRTEDQIVATIVRPTLDESIGPYGPPRKIYNFAFEESVARQIATDLLQHCGESSILPVMQIVCRDLFRSVVGDSRPETCRMISLRDYDRLGRVDGRVNAFIENSIRDVLRTLKRANPSEVEISRWQEVLANLVARQEGGVLTSLLVDEEGIVEDAKSRGIDGNISQGLKEMASEHSGLLRISEGAGATQFSLGHDALAPSLFQWREAREDILKERRAARRFKIALAITSGLILIGAAIVLWQIYQNRSQSLQLMATLSDNDSTPIYRSRVLLTLEAAIESSGLLSKQLSHAGHVRSLRQNLIRSPVFVSQPSMAIGFNDDRIVSLDRQGKVWVQSIDKPQTEQLIGNIPPRSADDQSQSAVGYISGAARPVAYQNGYLYWWPTDAKPDQPLRLELKSLLPAEFGTAGFTWVEITDGRVRVTQVTNSPRVYHFLDISLSGNKFVASEVRHFAWSYPLWPVYSQYSDKIAFLSSNKELLQTSRSTPSSKNQVGAIAEQSKLGKEGRDMVGQGPELFLEPIGFARDDSAILIRPSRSEILIFRTGTSEPLRLGIYEARQSAPIRPRFGFSRPLITGVKLDNLWRLAWLGAEGIDLLEASKEGLGTLVRAQPLLPAAPLDSIVRIELSPDGRWLVAVSQSGFLDPAVFRIWDLSSAYETKLDAMTLDELRDLACAVAGFEGSNRFSPIEVRNLFAGRDRQPCEGK